MRNKLIPNCWDSSITRQTYIKGKCGTPCTHIHDLAYSQLGTVTSIASGGVKLVVWSSHLREILLYCKYSPRVSIVPMVAHDRLNRVITMKTSKVVGQAIPWQTEKRPKIHITLHIKFIIRHHERLGFPKGQPFPAPAVVHIVFMLKNDTDLICINQKAQLSVTYDRKSC